MFDRMATLFTTFAIAAGAASVAGAQDIPAPEGEVILTVSGEVAVTNVDDTLQFDRETLAALGTTSVETSTIWTDGTHTFEGVSLADFAAFVGVEDGTFLATAINDYTVEIPVSDAISDGPIIASLMDGEEMSIRDKGPLWIIYPYDSSADYRTEVVYSRSIWQLDRIEIVN